MGAGKSTIGKELAKKLDYKFIDSDLSIEEENNTSIETLFNTIGENGFRKIETNWVNTYDTKNSIVALGGGTPCFNNNIEALLKKGIVIYLKVFPKVLAERLQKSKTVRPLITPFKNDREGLVKFIQQKLNERESFYSKANYVISGNSSAVYEIEKLLKKEV